MFNLERQLAVLLDLDNKILVDENEVCEVTLKECREQEGQIKRAFKGKDFGQEEIKDLPEEVKKEHEVFLMELFHFGFSEGGWWRYKKAPSVASRDFLVLLGYAERPLTRKAAKKVAKKAAKRKAKAKRKSAKPKATEPKSKSKPKAKTKTKAKAKAKTKTKAKGKRKPKATK